MKIKSDQPVFKRRFQNPGRFLTIPRIRYRQTRKPVRIRLHKLDEPTISLLVVYRRQLLRRADYGVGDRPFVHLFEQIVELRFAVPGGKANRRVNNIHVCNPAQGSRAPSRHSAIGGENKRRRIELDFLIYAVSLRFKLGDLR